jgi:hypothetical protein
MRRHGQRNGAPNVPLGNGGAAAARTPNALCTPPPHEMGRLERDGFVLESFPKGFVYRRVDP